MAEAIRRIGSSATSERPEAVGSHPQSESSIEDSTV
jgi:hypothetical protein